MVCWLGRRISKFLSDTVAPFLRYINQNNFFRQIRNFNLDLTYMNATNYDSSQSYMPTGIHWQVAQATSLQNIGINMPTTGDAQNTAVGIFMENGSGGFMSGMRVDPVLLFTHLRLQRNVLRCVLHGRCDILRRQCRFCRRIAAIHGSQSRLHKLLDRRHNFVGLGIYLVANNHHQYLCRVQRQFQFWINWPGYGLYRGNWYVAYILLPHWLLILVCLIRRRLHVQPRGMGYHNTCRRRSSRNHSGQCRGL